MRSIRGKLCSFQLHNARNLICYLHVVVDEILQQSRNLQAGPMQEVRTIDGTGSIEFEGLLERIKINHSQMDCLLETLQTTVQDLTLVVQQDPIGRRIIKEPTLSKSMNLHPIS